jgi:putative ABC transport system permease protein
VQSNYFETLGIPMLFGQRLPSRTTGSSTSVILSESASKRLWPGENPIGKRIRLSTEDQHPPKGELVPDGTTYEVVGVARDIRGSLMDGSDAEQVYLPLPEDRLEDYPILIRTQADPNQLRDTIAAAVSSVAPDLVAGFGTLDEMLRQTPPFIAAGISASIASTVGILGFLMASMGIYSTVSYLVVLRTQEVGIRMALGASKRKILALILRESGLPVLVGLFFGLLLSLETSKLLHGILYGLHRIDAVSFLGISGVFLAVSFLAAYIPSRRAMSVDPMVALRYE